MAGVLRFGNVAASCIFLFFLATNGASTKDKNGWIIHPESLFLLGMADGKEFFIDNSNWMNWIEAKTYCENAGMQLASITSAAQADMLNISYNSNGFRGNYWTGGRDALDLRQFVWDSDNKQPESNYVRFRKGRKNELTCLYYVSISGNSEFGNNDCTDTMRPLCDNGNLINK